MIHDGATTGLNPWNLFAGGAALGLVAGLWDKIKAVAWRALNLFVQQIEVPSMAAHEPLVAYLVAHYRRSRAYDRLYGAHYEHHRDGRYGLVPYEEFGRRSIIFWNGPFPFLFANAQEKKSKAGQPNAPHYQHQAEAAKVYSTITFIRGTLDVEHILRDACDKRNQLSWTAADAEEATKSRFRIHYVPPRTADDGDWDGDCNGLAWYQLGSYRLLAHKPEQLGKAPSAGRALDHLIFPPRVKELIREIELWRRSQQWYRDRGISWKRGWLLYGPPGTGKTALARAFAEDLNLPITVFNLAELGNRQLVRSWAAMQVNVPCIALFEDIDNVFHGRENVARKLVNFMPMMPSPANGDGRKACKSRSTEPVTFDCLLNCLDGVERADGIFTIITTNEIAKIDPALGQPRTQPDGSVEFISTRPGRVDKAVELGYLEPADKKRMAKRILGDYPAEYMAMLEFIDENPDLPETPAQFQERCGQIALACFWNDQRTVVAFDGSTRPTVRPATRRDPVSPSNRAVCSPIN
ncbi:MAG TPA: AAA family ATPase [Gemmataceae bacterium]|nr:AAA family ATPase [Gemmataceae bacterium]